jgi:hypothetical protein
MFSVIKAAACILLVPAPIVGALRKRDRAPNGAGEARCREVDCEILQVFSRRLAYWQKQDRSHYAHGTRVFRAGGR